MAMQPARSAGAATVAAVASPQAIQPLPVAPAPTFVPSPGPGPGASKTRSYVYTESNNPLHNTVLGYRRDPVSGSLRPLAGDKAAVDTGGRGLISGGGSRFGPDDADGEVIVTRGGQFLFAVNQGSNTVSIFAVRHTGRLKLLGQFDSGGVQPVSLRYNRHHLYVLNRGDSTDTSRQTAQPNLTLFDVSAEGVVTRRAGAVALPSGISPSQVLVDGKDRLLFVDNFATPSQRAALHNTLQSYPIQPDGSLAAPGAAVAPQGGGLLEGLALSPKTNIVYGGLPQPSGGVSVFTFDAKGGLTAGPSVAGGAGTCWAVVSPDGRFLYVTNTAADTVGVYSLANPLKPVRVQDFSLRRPPGDESSTTTGAFHVAVDSTGHNLYVINHGFTESFQPDEHLHTLVIDAGGTVSEPQAPSLFSTTQVTAQSHPQGIAVVTFPGTPAVV